MTSEQDRIKVDLESNTFVVNRVSELSQAIRGLSESGRIKGVGFDTFGTILTSLYTRAGQTDFLSKKICDYLVTTKAISLPVDQVRILYEEVRKQIKDGRAPLREIPIKQQECAEHEVLNMLAKKLRIEPVQEFSDYVQEAWLDFDLRNTKPLDGINAVLAESVRLLGPKHVGIFSNNSCSKKHLLSLLENNGSVGNGMVLEENVCISSEFGIQKYGIGVRKPNKLIFADFASQLELEPSDLAFAGDGGNDILFATESSGIGIKLSINA